VIRRLAGLVMLTVLIGGAVGLPAWAEVSESDVAEARDELRQLTTRLSEEVTRYELAVVEELELRDRLDELVVDLVGREQDLLLAQRAALERVADMYMSAGAVSSGALALGEMVEMPARFAYLDSVAQTDRAVVIRLDAARRDYRQLQDLLEEALTRQALLRGDMEATLDEIYAELEAANAEYQAIKAEWEAQEAERIRLEEEQRQLELFLSTSTTSTTTTVPPTTNPPTTTTAAPGETTTTAPGEPPSITGTTTTLADGDTTTTTQPPPPTTVPPADPGVRVCPVDGATTFRDSWGEPRPGGRGHAGTDLMAAPGTPLVAIESGVIWYMSWHYAGGNGLYIDGESGDRWYYAHLQDYAPGMATGVRVSAGQLVGYVGSTGNASTPHLHLGYLPGAVSYDNPYPIVAALC
jgi:murein DD-endopeptidase MepM/ murein hydrolase activator NlpD